MAMRALVPFKRPLLAVLIAVGGLIAVSAAPSALAADTAMTLKSTSVELPADLQTLPPGPGVDVVNANCSACHSPGMILAQPPLSKAAWQGEVTKMINVYKAPVAQGDVAPIVDYLAATKGAK